MKQNKELHLVYNFSYIVAFLVITIILLLTIKWTNLPNLVDYILFALAITSITLSILTIIYAIYSNYSLNKTVYSITNAADILSSNTKQLENTIDLVNTNILNIPKNILKIGKEIKEEIEPAVRTALEDSLNTSVAIEKTKSSKSIDEDFLLDFLNTNSLDGIFVTFCAYLSYKYKVPFNINEIGKITDSPTDYLLGQFISQVAIGLFTKHEIGDLEWIIENINDKLEKKILAIYQDRINSFISDNSDETWMKRKEKFYRNYETQFNDLYKNKKQEN